MTETTDTPLTASSTASTGHTILAAATLAIVAWLTYANILQASFIYDDINHILTNPYIRMKALTSDAVAGIFKGELSTRPLASLSFALNYYFHAYDVRGYHAVNLMIHILTALLVFLVGRATMRLCGVKTVLPALLAAIVWLVNPVHTQSVTYTVQRMNSLAAMFYLLAMFCYIRARTGVLPGHGRIRLALLYGSCLTSGLLSLAAKEIAATLPVMLFLYEWYFFQHLDRAWLKKQVLWIGPAVLLIAGLGFVYPGDNLLEKILSGYQKHDFTLSQRLLTQPSVVLYYICLLAFPHPDRLALIYDFPVFSSINTPLTALAGILGVSALVLAGILLSKKQRLLSFAVFWFLGNLVIESSFLGLALVFEHRTYLPSIFPLIALTALMMSSFRKRWPVVVVAGILIIIFGLWTHQRNTVWNDAIGFWRDNVAKAPQNTTVHNNLGQALLVAGKTKQAESHFQQAIAISPDSDHFNNLGLAMMKTGDMERAIAFFNQALRFNPRDGNTHFNLGTAWFQQKNLDRAREHLLQAARFAPDPVLALNNLATVLVMQKKYEAAVETLARLSLLRPENPAVFYNLACAYALKNDKNASVEALKKAVGLGYDRWHHLKADPDLGNIRDTDYFKHLTASGKM